MITVNRCRMLVQSLEVMAMSVALESRLLNPQHKIKRGEPAWDIALLYPPQGHWTEEEYLALGTNWMVEFVDGYLEVLPMPLPYHQLIMLYLLDQLRAFVAAHAPG